MAQDALVGSPPESAAAIATARRLATFQSLSIRDYRLLWLGQLFSSSSMWMENVARPLLILHLTNSALQVGLLSATRMFPMLIVGVWAGVVADRMDKRKILLACQSVTFAAQATTAALILTGSIEPWMVFVTTFVAGSSMAFNQPARQSLIPRLVPEGSIANAIALNSAAMNVTRIGGASLAGLVLVFLDLGDLYLLQSLIYVWVLVWTLQMRSPQEGEARRQRTTMLTDLREGVAAVRQDRLILSILALSLILFVWAFPYQSVFVPLIAVNVLDIGRSGAGLLVSLTGVGALIGSLTVATIGGSLRRVGLVMIGLLLLNATALLLFAQAGSLYLAVPALLVTGATQTSFMSVNNAFVLMRTPRELQGRVMSLFSLDRGLIPLGATIGGALAASLGPQMGLTIMALVCFSSLAVAATLLPTLRRLD
jgi:MFS family permease